MPIHHAVLALLGQGPSHGYQLKADFETAVGPQWGGLNIGHLYQVLDRLVRDGFVTSTRIAQDAKPDRVVYEITQEGTAELGRWLSEPAARTTGFRDDFFLKIMAAARTDSLDVLLGLLAIQRGYLLRELRNLQMLQTKHGADVVVRLLLSAASQHITADLCFLDDVEHTLAKGRAAPRIAGPTAPVEPSEGVEPSEREQPVA